MSSDGNYGDGAYGVEYYSARIQEGAGPTIIAASSIAEFGQVIHVAAVNAINAASSMLAQAAVRIRTSALAIAALSSGVWAGIKFWEQSTDTSAPWAADPDTTPSPWLTTSEMASPWVASPDTTPNPWTPASGTVSTWTPVIPGDPT